MGNNTWDNVLDPHPTARGGAKNTFTAFQDVAGTGTTQPLPFTNGGELKPGTRFEIEARGEFSTTLTPTLQIGAIYGATAGAAGGVALAQSGAITTGTATAWPWHYNISGIVTGTGTAGTIYCQGILDLGTSLIAVASSWCPVTAAARAVTGIDTTVTKAWGLGAAWSASSASNSITVDVFTVHILNQGKT
jgi:hypothetical protein